MARTVTISVPTLAAVMAGGAVGATIRAILTVPLTDTVGRIGIAVLTLAINLVGAFLLGVVVARLGTAHPRWRAFLGTGMLGGFTTYSAFTVQSIQLFGAAPLVGLLLVALSIVGGALAAGLGLSLGRSPTDPESVE